MHLTRLLLTLGTALTLSALAMGLFATRFGEHATAVRVLATVEGLVGVLLLLGGALRWSRGPSDS